METSTAVASTSGGGVRSLQAADLDAVVALDHRITGYSRRGYFERRLAAALKHPARHLQLAATTPAGLAGFVLARLAGGEYGKLEAALVLEAVGVAPESQRAGFGRRMMASLEERGRACGARDLLTHADWHNHAMLKFLDRAGFSLAPRQVLERPVHRMPLPETDVELERQPPLIRHLRAADLDAIVRIDRLVTGRDRTEYLRRKCDEALHDSGIVVSLAAEDDGFVVAFAMARVDLGDFGQVGASAALDTLGVQRGFAHRGLARAVLTQMIDNLSALHVETLETEVGREDFELLRFLYRFGFGPSQRLAFVRKL
jgi:ribosomal protein S18 acetylase RimI-like enzyme